MEGKYFRQRGSKYKVLEQHQALVFEQKEVNVARRSEGVKARPGAEVEE